MIEGLINLILGPFILGGIIIIAFTIMSGGKADRAFTGYIKLCGQLMTAVLMPVIRKLPYFVTWAGHQLDYLLDAQMKANQETSASANGGYNRSSGQQAGAGQGVQSPDNVIVLQVKDITEERKKGANQPTPKSNPYEEPPSVDILES